MLGRQARRASHTLDAMAPIAGLVPGVGPELAAGMHGLSAELDQYKKAARELRGSGMYTAPMVNDSEVIEFGQRFGQPHFQADNDSSDDGGLVISNQEFVTNVYANGAGELFNSQVFTVNPGLPQTFPMLSQFAVNFERYEMIQCVFHYETALDSGVLQSTTGQVGDILMYSHIDPTEPAFQSVADFMSNGGSLTQVTKGLTVGVECDPEQLVGLPNAGINMVRNGPILDVDQTEADQATVQVAVADTPASLTDHVIGKLYVSYTVKLLKPRLMSLVGASVMSDVFAAISNTSVTSGSDFKVFADFGSKNAPSRLPHSNIGGVVETVSNDESHLKITFPPWLNGTYRVRIRTANQDPPPEEDQTNVFGIVIDATSEPSDFNWMGMPMITQPVVTGNVTLLPLGLEARNPGAIPYQGNNVVSHYQFGDSSHTSTAGRSLDNQITFSRFKPEGSNEPTGHRFQGYAEFTLRVSPATSNVDNTVSIQANQAGPDWFTASQTLSLGLVFTTINVETANNFGLSRSTKLKTWMDQLSARNSSVVEYEACLW